MSLRKLGDSRIQITDLEPVDRIIMNLPHSAFEYLPSAFSKINIYIPDIKDFKDIYIDKNEESSIIYIEAQKDEILLKIRIAKITTKDAAKEYMDYQLNMINSTYEPIKSPYPGRITRERVCPEELKPLKKYRFSKQVDGIAWDMGAIEDTSLFYCLNIVKLKERIEKLEEQFNEWEDKDIVVISRVKLEKLEEKVDLIITDLKKQVIKFGEGVE